MLSREAQMILSLVKTTGTMDGQDIEIHTGLSELVIKTAAVELRQRKLVKTSGASDANQESGMAIDRLTITPLGKSVC